MENTSLSFKLTKGKFASLTHSQFNSSAMQIIYDVTYKLSVNNA